MNGQLSIITLENLENIIMNKQHTYEDLVRLSNGIFPKFGGYGWEDVCLRHTLSEDFIREWKDKINWKAVRQYQYFNLSPKFKKEFEEKLYGNKR